MSLKHGGKSWIKDGTILGGKMLARIVIEQTMTQKQKNKQTCYNPIAILG